MPIKHELGELIRERWEWVFADRCFIVDGLVIGKCGVFIRDSTMLGATDREGDMLELGRDKARDLRVVARRWESEKDWHEVITGEHLDVLSVAKTASGFRVATGEDDI